MTLGQLIQFFWRLSPPEVIILGTWFVCLCVLVLIKRHAFFIYLFIFIVSEKLWGFLSSPRSQMVGYKKRGRLRTGNIRIKKEIFRFCNE